MIIVDASTCIQDFIESQAVRCPDVPAVICGNEVLTYRKLNSRANQLAHYMRALGVGAESVVGICTHRSVDMVVGILGILKAGGAYLPLDPSYPQERISYILKDSGAQLLLTQSGLERDTLHTICLDQISEDISTLSIENPEKITSSDNLAYIIYTSGSTGNPKGVMITHSNLCHFVRIASSALDIYQQDVYLQSASIAYALSVRQLMVPLSFGSTVILATSEEARDPLRLFELIKKQNVTLMDMVPSFWRTCMQRLSDLLEDERKNLLDNRLRRIVTVGEPLYSDIPQDWKYKFEHTASLVNIFGQTETTGIVAAYPIPDEPQIPAGIVPIGKNIPDTKVYILDANLQPVTGDEAGELCVSNPCIARGYLNQPDLTAKKFIPNPFADNFSDRLYRTGDLARYNGNGDIQFLGRGDQQVKIRGQRLELSEVEIVLRQCFGIRECVVALRGDSPDDAYLAAYVVLSEGQNLTSRELRVFLKQHLPDYMVPSFFVFLNKMPLTPNGKIDRLSLPDPRHSYISKNITFHVDARNDIERKVAMIWRELLKINPVGIHDDFFDLGGQSFLAVRLFSRIEQDLGVRLPLTTLFQATTVAQISALIKDRGRSKNGWSPVVPIQTKGDKPPFFGVHGHEGGVLFWRDVVNYLPGDQPFYAVQAQGVDGLQPALTHIEDMARLYIAEIRKIQAHGPYLLGGYSIGGVIAYEMSQQLFQVGERVALLTMLDTYNPKRINIQGSATNSHKVVAMAGDTKFSQRINKYFHRLTGTSIKERLALLAHDLGYRIKRRLTYFQVNAFRILHKRLHDTLLLSYLRFTHSQAVRDYIPSGYSGKVTLFRASESANANPEDSFLSWKNLVNGNFEVFYFNATHNMLSAEYAKEVAEQLIECLAKTSLF